MEHIDSAFVVVCGISLLFSLRCLWTLWRSGAPLWKKIPWSLMALLPLFGPLFYGAFFRLPSKTSDEMKASPTFGV